MARKRNKHNGQAVDQLVEMRQHLRALGLETFDEYRDWCTEHGFKSCLKKSARQRQAEYEYHRDRIACERLKNYRKNNDVAFQIKRIFDSETDIEELDSEVLARVAYCSRESGQKALLKEVLIYLAEKSRLLDDVDSVTAVANMVEYSHCWIRTLDSWRPATHNRNKQLRSLLCHLFVLYEMPAFMHQAWQGNKKEMGWYIHIGAGKNIRHARGLPVSMTKKMAHGFLQAPENYSIDAAFRYSQVMSLGGSRLLADTLRGTRLVDDYRDDAFVMSVLRFFVDNPMLDLHYVGPIIDYIWNQKYEDRIVFIERGVAQNMGPVEPGFSMHGRTVTSLIRQMERWHRQLGRERRNNNLQWVRSDIREFDFVTAESSKKDNIMWTIRELLSSRELVQEGRKQHHCVATYARSCFRGRSSIWTLDRIAGVNREKALTIEVNSKTRTICQIRGKYNRMASDGEYAVIKRWAAAENLKIEAYA